MFYTLLKFLWWGLLLGLVGGGIGWALRALKCRGELAQARSSDEVDALRRRVADFDQVVAERDRLRMQVADMRHVESPGIVGAPDDDTGSGAASDGGAPRSDSRSSIVDDRTAGFVGIVDGSSGSDDAGSGDDMAQESNAAGAAGDVGGSGDDTDIDDRETTADPAADSGSVAVPLITEPEPVAMLDLDAAKDAIGKKIKVDDLTVIEGIGPKIADLCLGIGVTTWQALADTPVVDLQSMLDDAGSRYKVHNPGSWPRQARLLAQGEWAEFKTLTDELDHGK